LSEHIDHDLPLSRARLASGQVVEEPLQASFDCFVPFDLAWPAAGGGVLDELLLDLEASAKARGARYPSSE
jgi:hypothetical protein